MSRRIKLPHCRKFPPRISQEDLKAQTTEVMKEKGANYHFQAQFYEATSHEVVGSKEPKFCTLQPKIVPHDEEPWAQAYEFVYDFLAKNGMDLTLSTLKVEFGKGKEPKNGGMFDDYPRDEFFSGLMEVSDAMKGVSFKDRVEEFSEQERLNATD